jgi:hypothetical protein
MKNIKNLEDFLLESYNEASLDELFCEAVRRTADQIHKEADDKIKEQIAKYSELMKSNPEKADLYKAQLDLTHAKQTVLAMKQKLQQVKDKY